MVSLVVWRFCLFRRGILILGGHGNEGSSQISLLGCSLVVAASIVFACCLRLDEKKWWQRFQHKLIHPFQLCWQLSHDAIYFIDD